jgi:hypothetical protein
MTSSPLRRALGAWLGLGLAALPRPPQQRFLRQRLKWSVRVVVVAVMT